MIALNLENQTSHAVPSLVVSPESAMCASLLAGYELQKMNNEKKTLCPDEKPKSVVKNCSQNVSKAESFCLLLRNK